MQYSDMHHQAITARYLNIDLTGNHRIVDDFPFSSEELAAYMHQRTFHIIRMVHRLNEGENPPDGNALVQMVKQVAIPSFYE